VLGASDAGDRSGAGWIDPDTACLDAFQQQLDYIHATLRRLGTARADIEDLTQEVFLALRRAWATCDLTRPLRPYLFGIAFRIAAAHRRKRGREVPVAAIEATDDRSADLDEVLQSKQARMLVLAALERVPLRRRAVLVMHDLDDVPVVQVAAVLGIRVFTAYGRLRKGRRELASALRRKVTRTDDGLLGFALRGRAPISGHA
jgi:RNA polymerase sigma-70 factor (ECF subfamily)